MRHSAILLCLLAALSGTPLRQAEAADDLSRALVKFLQPASIETPDGGVGDDSCVGTLRPANHVQVSLDRGPASWTVASLSLLIPPHFAQHDARRWRQQVAWPPTASSRDPAWLQVFLF